MGLKVIPEKPCQPPQPFYCRVSKRIVAPDEKCTLQLGLAILIPWTKFCCQGRGHHRGQEFIFWRFLEAHQAQCFLDRGFVGLSHQDSWYELFQPDACKDISRERASQQRGPIKLLPERTKLYSVVKNYSRCSIMTVFDHILRSCIGPPNIMR